MKAQYYHKELKDKKQFSKLTSTGISDDLENVFEFAESYQKAELNLLTIPGVSISKAKEYAVFCVECDRKGFKLLELNDWLKL